MQTIVELTKPELEVFLCIYKRKGIPGIIGLSPQSEIDQNILDKMNKKGYFINDENNKRWVDSLIELILLTILNSESRLECYKSDNDFQNIYFHGKTIVYLIKPNDREVYTLMWIPVLSIAIGGLVEYFNQVPQDSRILEGSILLDNKVNQDYSPQKAIETLVLYGNHELNNVITGYSSSEVIAIKRTDFNNDNKKIILMNNKENCLLIDINRKLDIQTLQFTFVGCLASYANCSYQ